MNQAVALLFTGRYLWLAWQELLLEEVSSVIPSPDTLLHWQPGASLVTPGTKHRRCQQGAPGVDTAADFNPLLSRRSSIDQDPLSCSSCWDSSADQQGFSPADPLFAACRQAQGGGGGGCSCNGLWQTWTVFIVFLFYCRRNCLFKSVNLYQNCVWPNPSNR